MSIKIIPIIVLFLFTSLNVGAQSLSDKIYFDTDSTFIVDSLENRIFSLSQTYGISPNGLKNYFPNEIARDSLIQYPDPDGTYQFVFIDGVKSTFKIFDNKMILIDLELRSTNYGIEVDRNCILKVGMEKDEVCNLLPEICKFNDPIGRLFLQQFEKNNNDNVIYESYIVLFFDKNNRVSCIAYSS